MKILFFNYEYPPLGGGAGSATYFILREFSKNTDLDVDLITSSIDSEFHLEHLGNNIKIHRLPIGKGEGGLHFQTKKDLMVYPWKAFWYSRKLIKQNNYNLTHSFFTVPCGVLSFYFWWINRIPYVISLRGSDVPGYSERFRFLYLFLRPIIKLIWSKSNSIVANSIGLRDLALETEKKKDIKVICNGVDIEKFNPQISEADNGNALNILCVSRITPRKGIRYIINAVKLLSDKHQNIKLTIIGEGNEKKELEDHVKENNLQGYVEFLGRIDHDRLPEYYSSADVFVSASFNEGMSNTMLEAIASGLPIIATKTGGTDELVKDGQNGFVIQKENSEDIAKKLDYLFSNEQLRVRMSGASRELATKLSWSSVAEAYLEEYKKVCTNKANG